MSDAASLTGAPLVRCTHSLGGLCASSSSLSRALDVGRVDPADLAREVPTRKFNLVPLTICAEQLGGVSTPNRERSLRPGSLRGSDRCRRRVESTPTERTQRIPISRSSFPSTREIRPRVRPTPGMGCDAPKLTMLRLVPIIRPQERWPGSPRAGPWCVRAAAGRTAWARPGRSAPRALRCSAPRAPVRPEVLGGSRISKR
jgi:hypothetical protein